MIPCIIRENFIKDVIVENSEDDVSSNFVETVKSSLWAQPIKQHSAIPEGSKQDENLLRQSKTECPAQRNH